MKSSLLSFEEDLLQLIGKPTDLRPFVCDGSPLDCEVFIVGLNPASEMDDDFWHFWSSDYGFLKMEWFEAYKKSRRERPLKPGKTRRNEVSNTRRVIEWIVQELSPVRCLETNIFAKASEQYADLSIENLITEPLNFLIEKINPKTIVAHGNDAWEHLIKHTFTGTKVNAAHFSRGWSRIKAQQLAEQIRESL